MMSYQMSYQMKPYFDAGLKSMPALSLDKTTDTRPTSTLCYSINHSRLVYTKMRLRMVRFEDGEIEDGKHENDGTYYFHCWGYMWHGMASLEWKIASIHFYPIPRGQFLASLQLASFSPTSKAFTTTTERHAADGDRLILNSVLHSQKFHSVSELAQCVKWLHSNGIRIQIMWSFVNLNIL